MNKFLIHNSLKKKLGLFFFNKAQVEFLSSQFKPLGVKISFIVSLYLGGFYTCHQGPFQNFVIGSKRHSQSNSFYTSFKSKIDLNFK